MMIRQEKSYEIPTSTPVQAFAALDLGTVACRLLITDSKLNILDSFTRVTRIGDGVAENGYISKEAALRTIDALSMCKQKILNHSVSTVRCVATAACRHALNGIQFVESVYTHTGLKLEIISPDEEARLAVKSISDMLDASIPYAIIFDIGGGSTEIMWVETGSEPQLIDWISLPFGIVNLAETRKTYSSISSFVDSIKQLVTPPLLSFLQKETINQNLKHNSVQMLGTSGTITTLAALILGLESYDREKVNNLNLPLTDIQKTIDYVYRLSHDECILHPCIGHMRADLVHGGIAIFNTILENIPVNTVKATSRGLVNGMLIDLTKTSAYSKVA